VNDRLSPGAGSPPAGPERPPALDAGRFGVLGTPLAATSYAALSDFCHWRARQPGSVAIEFANVHIVTARRHEPWFRELTSSYDHFIPDATPLVWCLNWQRARLRERVYGPTFMRECLTRTTAEYRHYLLGGSEACGQALRDRMLRLNPAIQFVGSFHGRCGLDGRLEGAGEVRVEEDLRRFEPDFVWVGLGTPKQDAWIQRHKAAIPRGMLLSVGFAFDVNAGTKRDAPAWMQRWGLTWLFRMASEPRRLVGRYVKYNSLFLAYLAWDGARGRAFGRGGEGETAGS